MSDPFVTNAEFKTTLDIAKRVADHLGQSRPITLSDPGKLVEIFNDIYGKIRQAELRRNTWKFAIKRSCLRPMDTTTRVLIPPAWSATTGTPNPLGFYQPGSIVSYLGAYYTTHEKVLNSDVPGSDNSAWMRYFGPIAVSPWDTTGKTTYFPGELVYIFSGAGAVTVFMALQTTLVGAINDPRVAEDWAATVTYALGEGVTFSSVTYYSNIDLNLNQTPGTDPGWTAGTVGSQQWVPILGATLELHRGIYPIGSGPSSQTFTRNVYMLPFGFLRVAPEDPKAGSVSILGAPSNIMYRDYDLEGNFIVSRESLPILYRYVADMADITLFDAMFAEGIGCRIAYEGCEAITQSTERRKNIQQDYALFMGEARKLNGIEIGAIQPPVDDYISCRL